jgi:hypothetical protein
VSGYISQERPGTDDCLAIDGDDPGTLSDAQAQALAAARPATVTCS